MDRNCDAIIVGYNHSTDTDTSVLIVGRQNIRGVTDIINAFDGDEAKKLYEKLVTKEEK